MLNIKREISRTIPDNIPDRYFLNGKPILTAYGCALLEMATGKSYIYTAVNLSTGKSEIMVRRSSPLTISSANTIIGKMRISRIAGAGVLEVDRAFKSQITYFQCRKILTAIFNEILPQHGYAVRKEQISLAEHILEAACHRRVSLAEAEVGTGKTLAYLISAILAKRGRVNDYWNMGYYPGMPYAQMSNMPIVIATSSIALQKAIITDYIPELSNILLEHGIIRTPLTAALRKGREHYVCKRNLQTHALFECNPRVKKVLEGLLSRSATIDLAEVDGLTPYVKRKISVPDRCDKNCPNRNSCQYLRFREKVGSSEIDIQVCNHNYLLADTLRRAEGQRPLIPNYQSIIIDEAHKFLQAARSMYGVELSSLALSDIKDSISEINLKRDDAKILAIKLARKLYNEGRRLFRRLVESTVLPGDDETGEEPSQLTADIDADATRHLRNIQSISGGLVELFKDETAIGNSKGRKAQVVWELSQVRDQAAILSQHNKLICWVEALNRNTSPGTANEVILSAIPKDLDNRLFNDLWSKGIPTILTSGTLSAAGDFSHIKRSLGIERVSAYRVVETSKPSPFDYYENSLLYISENMPFPDQRNKDYITTVADEIHKLVIASHGHAAILFTSYKAMDMVWELLAERDIPFPMFRLDKGGVKEIERFKQSGNGIMFAAGALWEGIDIPGDALSMLIIVKLPFAVPDPIGEYEQTLYSDMNEYKKRVIVPEMLVKLKQGHGRAIRIEADTSVIAILDSRVNKSGAYRERVLEALPECYVTDDMSIVEGFIQVKKPPAYFE